MIEYVIVYKKCEGNIYEYIKFVYQPIDIQTL